MITRALGVEPVFINSATLSAQNRQRHYWCNWYIPEPANRGIMLADILETDPSNVVVMTDTFVKRQVGRKCLVDDFNRKASNLSAMEYVKNGRQGDYVLVHRPVLKLKSHTVRSGGLNSPPQARQNWDNAYDSKTRYRKFTPVECERLQGLPDNYTLGPSNTQRYIMLGNGWQCDTIEHIFFWLLVGR